MQQIDHAAMTAAIEMARAKGEPIDAMLHAQPWEEVALWAVGVCQIDALRLRPWECPPCQSRDLKQLSDHYGSRPSEVALLRRMKRANISIYHPDPLPELERIERESAA